jgi:hypothetical protein
MLYIPCYITRLYAAFMLLSIIPYYTVGPIVINSFFTASVLLYTLAFRPFKSITNNVTAALIEILVLGCNVCSIGFYSALSTYTTLCSWLIIGISLGIISALILFYLIMGWIKLLDMFYLRRFGHKKKYFVGLLSKIRKTPQPVFHHD